MVPGKADEKNFDLFFNQELQPHPGTFFTLIKVFLTVYEKN
jgi:hypothetical protein